MTPARAWAAAWLAVAMVAGTFALLVAGGGIGERLRSEPLASLATVAVGFSLAGSAVWSRTRRIGGIMLTVGVSSALSLLAHEYGRFALVEHGDLPLGRAAATAGWMLWAPGFGLAVGVLPAVFPDGRLLSRRWGTVVVAAFAGIAIAMVGSLLAANAAPIGELFTSETPKGPAARYAELANLGRSVMLLAGAAAVTSLVVRYRRADATVRRQLLWLVLGSATTVALLAAASLVEVVWLLFEVLAVLAMPVALVIAISRHGLWDIERLVSRATVYVAMSTLVGLGYLVVILAASTIFRDRSSAGAAAIAAIVIAVAFQPARDLLQGRVERLVYGTRRDAPAALRALRERVPLEGSRGELLAAVASSLREDLRLAYVAIQLAGEPEAIAVSGVRRPGLELPLTLEKTLLGTVTVAPEVGDAIGAQERRTLDAVAGQVALLVFASGLVDDLKRSRELIIVAREEERRRLRRDIHDGLGPALAGLALQASAAVNLAASDPNRSAELLGRIAHEATEITHDVRRLIYGLRPPALDELGLLGAIEQHAAALTANGTTTPHFCVRGDGDLDGLPAAVEVAAYRIAIEALTNVHRHARASSCDVLVRRDGWLHVVVRDDGQGLHHGAPGGVGLLSMRERVDELGGVLAIESGPSGTEIRAEVPIP